MQSPPAACVWVTMNIRMKKAVAPSAWSMVIDIIMVFLPVSRRKEFVKLMDHTGAKILNSSKNSHYENLNFYKIHILKITFFTKFTILKSHFSQNSQF